MQVEKLLPPFADEFTYLFLVGGDHGEVLARNRGEGWEIKTERCSQCARCCIDGGCDYVQENGDGKSMCGHPDTMPFSCIRGGGRTENGCTLKFEKVR